MRCPSGLEILECHLTRADGWPLITPSRRPHLLLGVLLDQAAGHSYRALAGLLPPTAWLAAPERARPPDEGGAIFVSLSSEGRVRDTNLRAKLVASTARDSAWTAVALVFV